MGYANPAAIIFVSVFFPVIGAFAVGLRFYTRHYQRTAPNLDDWLILPAWILECGLASLLLWGATNNSLGLPIPKPNVPGPEGYVFSDSPQQTRFLQIQYFFDLFGVWEFGIIKLSILFFYRKIFCSTRVTKTKFDLLTRAMVALVIVWMLAFGIGAIFLCGADPSAAWSTLFVIMETCPAQLPFLQGFAISDFITDCLILLLPIPAVWSLHMPTRRRLGIIGVFLVGILALAASATRMTIYNMYIVNAFSQPDGETLVTVLLFWSMIECGLGVIVACLPTLRPLYGHFAPEGLLNSLRGAFSLHSFRGSSTFSKPSVDDTASTGSEEPKMGIHTYAARSV